MLKIHSNNINSEINSNDIIAYPNPAVDEKNIDIPWSKWIANIKITSLTGQTILVQTVNEPKINLKGEFSDGLHVIEIRQKDKIYFTEILINK